MKEDISSFTERDCQKHGYNDLLSAVLVTPFLRGDVADEVVVAFLVLLEADGAY